jgi:hypothetical protein
LGGADEAGFEPALAGREETQLPDQTGSDLMLVENFR